MTEPSQGHVDAARVTIYRDSANEWRWSARDTNGETVADSGEGYERHTDAVNAAQDLFPNAEILELTSD
jgi:uncharacterized protein YegP (UPF0339 family)